MNETNLDSRTVALRNKRFYRSIQYGQFYEWQIVALFYSALHIIDHYAEVLGQKRYADHYQRNMFVNKTPGLKPIRALYKHLYSQSREARYEGVMFDPKAVQDTLGMHAVIISHVCKLLRSRPPGRDIPLLH